MMLQMMMCTMMTVSRSLVVCLAWDCLVFDLIGRYCLGRASLGWSASNGGVLSVASVRLVSGGCAGILPVVHREGIVLRSCTAGSWTAWPNPTCCAFRWRSSSVMFGLVGIFMYVMFVIEFGLFLDVAAESYLLYTVKAQVFGSVRLGGHRHVHFTSCTTAGRRWSPVLYGKK